MLADGNKFSIAETLTQGTVVTRCFVKGKTTSSSRNSFITEACNDSTITRCAVGTITRPTLSIGTISWRLQSTQTSDGLITGYIRGKSTLENNCSIDSNDGTDDANGHDGKAVAATLFKQRYFEYTLGWDFDAIWQWDDKEDRPALRSVGVGARPPATQPTEPKASMVDLLTQQMRANIWL